MKESARENGKSGGHGGGTESWWTAYRPSYSTDRAPTSGSVAK